MTTARDIDWPQVLADGLAFGSWIRAARRGPRMCGAGPSGADRPGAARLRAGHP